MKRLANLLWAVAVALPNPVLLAEAKASPTNTVLVLDTSGKVEVLKGALRRTARAKDPLLVGDQIQTSTNSHANLRWYDYMPFQLSELSTLLIPPPPGAGKPSRLEVLKGLLYFFHRGKPGAFEVQTPTATAVVLGTEFALRVEPNGRTVVLLFEGQVFLSSAGVTKSMSGGEQGVVDPGLPPVVTPIIQAVNDLIQWFLYYPSVLNVDEVGFAPAEEQQLEASLSAYRRGDLREALAQYPPGREPASNADKIYVAALLLTVGQVDKAEAILATLNPGGDPAQSLAAALRKLIAAVKGQPDPSTVNPQLSTSLLADSYYHQSRADLPKALEAAASAAEASPHFGFAWARLAELEFSFGHSGKALSAGERSLELSPRNAQALTLKGFLLAGENRIGRAIEFFDQAIELDGGLGNAWLGRGLCRIRRGQADAGREDLLVAAGVEPQRALLRSYLGKAFGDEGELFRALEEMRLAKHLDTNDPTACLYSALLNQQEGRINEAVRDLEKSQELNDNRRLYRSRLLLDQDRAVRGANLANIYADAGMMDVSVREAVRAVNADYGNYSAHLFLANSFNEIRDPNQISLRYETAWFTEYLLANLLAPVGAGILSQSVSQQEYSKLFERNRLGLSSSTEYFSQGDWFQSAVQYGIHGNSSYALESFYRSRNGHRPNNDFEQLALNLLLKQQLTPRDSIFLRTGYYDAEGGDVNQYYDESAANPGFRTKESQEPTLLGGYHHEWSPGSHTLLLAGRLQAAAEIFNPDQGVWQINRTPFPPFISVQSVAARHELETELELYTAELQQIWQTDRHTLIFGGRYQRGDFLTENHQSDFRGTSTSNLISQEFANDLERRSLYGYYYWQIVPPLQLVTGVAYDWQLFPENFRFAPITNREETVQQVSPKGGLIWTPGTDTTIRAGFSRSLGGVSLEQSHRLEPSQVAGFNQAFRSLIPETVAGFNSSPEFETWGFSIEQKLGKGTYLGISGELLKSELDRTLGIVNWIWPPPGSNPLVLPAQTREQLRYRERSLAFTANQLLGDEWSLGARYRFSVTDLQTEFVDIPSTATFNPGIEREQNLEASLHQVNLFALYNHPSGFFGQFDSLWNAQSNHGYNGTRPGDDFWQFNCWLGYRFPHRRAEVRLGLLNFTDQDYRLNPLNLTTELPRERTFAASFRFYF